MVEALQKLFFQYCVKMIYFNVLHVFKFLQMNFQLKKEEKVLVSKECSAHLKAYILPKKKSI